MQDLNNAYKLTELHEILILFNNWEFEDVSPEITTPFDVEELEGDSKEFRQSLISYRT